MTKLSGFVVTLCCVCPVTPFAVAQSTSHSEPPSSATAVGPSVAHDRHPPNSPQATGGPRVLPFTSGVARYRVALAVRGAALRLGGSDECRLVLSDFKDVSGDMLATNLIRFAADPSAYLMTSLTGVGCRRKRWVKRPSEVPRHSAATRRAGSNSRNLASTICQSTRPRASARQVCPVAIRTELSCAKLSAEGRRAATSAFKADGDKDGGRSLLAREGCDRENNFVSAG